MNENVRWPIATAGPGTRRRQSDQVDQTMAGVFAQSGPVDRVTQTTLSLWYLGLDSELVFVGDAGTSEAERPSRRVGLEWTNYWRLRPWLIADADLSFSYTEFTDTDPVGQRIPGALTRVVSGGFTVEPRQPLFGSVRVRHFGPRPLIEDASVSPNSTTLWNGEVAYRLSNKARIVSRCSTCSTRRCRTSTTSTPRVCRESRWTASTMSTPIRRCRGPHASACVSLSKPTDNAVIGFP